MEDEEKDLPQNMREELAETKKYYENVRLELDKIILNNVLLEEKQKQNEQGKDIVEYNVYIQYKGENVRIASIDTEGNLVPNNDILNNIKYTDDDKKKLGDMLNLLGLEHEKVDLSKLKTQLQELEAKTKEEIEQSKNKTKEESIKDEEYEEKNEEEQQSEENHEITKIATLYNVSSKDIVHLNTKNKKLTEKQAFGDLVKWAEGKDDIYVIANRKGAIQTVLEKKGNEYEEVKQDMQQVHGNIPNVEIHLVGKDRITTVVPLKVYQIDSKQAIATIRNNWGELETVYCRKQEGKQEYFGEIVPEEKSNKNVRQLGYEERSFMDTKNTSGLDLSKKADELERAQDRDSRGVPSKEKGVQVEEIDGSKDQNIQLEKENIKEDLYKRMGLDDKMKSTLMPGQLEYIEEKIDKEADKIQLLMQEDMDITYEEAVEKVEKQEKTREEGGITPGENRRRSE